MRPSLAYWYALDICASIAHVADGPVGLLTSSSFYYEALNRRLPDHTITAQQEPTSSLAPCRSIVWAEPERTTMVQTMHAFQSIETSHSLSIITSNWLSTRLPERQRSGNQPAMHPMGTYATLRTLRQADYTISALYGLQSPLSIARGYIWLLCERLAFSRIGDQFHIQMRSDFVVAGWQSFVTPVSIIVARKL